MRIGQTSFVVFFSKAFSSAVGFVATLYFARELGAEVLGLYALMTTVVGWLILVGELGIGSAMTKRISEATEQGKYFSAAIIWVVSFAVILSLVVIISEPVLEHYMAGFDQYVPFPVVWFIVIILFVNLFYKMAVRTLNAERKVHLQGFLEAGRTGGRGLLQIALVLVGYGLFGMLAGYIISSVIVGIVGIYWVNIRLSVPQKKHFKSLFNYAKFSWLGSLKSRTFNEVDILLLGVFVQPALVGVYSVAWSLARFLELFGSAISTTMFPEISFTSAQKTNDATAGLIEDALAFTGLIAIPGFVGGILLAELLMRIYGPEFDRGTTVLGLLILAVLLYSYQKQLMNALNGLDRPDISFRINGVFIIINSGMNIILIPYIGIEGAAIASVVSVIISLALAYRALHKIVEFNTPVGEIARQSVAATIMGTAVVGALRVIEITGFFRHNAVTVLVLILFGASVYFLFLIAISSRFRSTIARNSPITLPFVK